MEHMRLLAENSDCRDGNCPKVYDLEDGENLAVQGYTMDSEELPEGESMVRVPRELLIELAKKLLVETAQ